MGQSITAWNTAVGLETETTYGTDPATSRTDLELISEDITRSYETLIQVDTRGRQERNNASQGRESVSGSFSIFANSENLGLPLYYVTGTSPTATNPTEGADTAILTFEHAFDVAAIQLPSFTTEIDYGEVAAEAKVITGCVMNSLDIELEEGLVTVSCGVDAQTLVEDQTPTGVSFTDWPRTFDFKDFTMTIDGTDATTEIISGTVSLANANDAADYRQGNQQTQCVTTGPFSATATLEVIYDPAVDAGLQDFFDGTVTDKTVIITYTGDDIETVGATTFTHKLELTLPHCYSEQSTPTVSGPGERVRRSVTLRSLHEYGATPDGFEAVLWNTRSTAYT